MPVFVMKSICYCYKMLSQKHSNEINRINQMFPGTTLCVIT